MSKEEILKELDRLGAELRQETAELEKEGYKITSEYNRATGRDDLIVNK